MDPYPKIYVEGHPYPMKGYPTADAVAAINVVKKIVPFLWIPRLRQAALMALYPFVLLPQYMLPPAKELRFPGDFGLILSHIVEYDSAYRVRLQAMLSVMSVTELHTCPIRSIIKMIRYNRTQDYTGAHRKIRACGVLLILWLLVPSHRRSWREGLRTINFQNLVFDEGDLYWFHLRNDYGPNNPHRGTIG